MLIRFLLLSCDLMHRFLSTNKHSHTHKKQVSAHIQAWAWQDEWYGLTMEDIREFERETQLILQRKMGLDGEDEDEDGKNNENIKNELFPFINSNEERTKNT